MDNNNPTPSITEQFDVVFDKAIAEIEQEESALEAQIRELTEQKTVLTKRREQLTDLREQVEDLTEGLREADEQYEAEIKKKEELDAEIEQTANTLAHLKESRQEVETRVESAENEKRAKHEQLAHMRTQFGESVNIEGADEVITNLERTVIDTRETEFSASVAESEPAIEASLIPDEEPMVADDTSAPDADLTPDDAENEVEEEVQEQPERIPEVITIATDLEAEALALEDTPSEDADDEIAAFTAQPQTLDEIGEVKQPSETDNSDDQPPAGAIDVDFDELTHDEAEDDEASEDGLVRISEVEVSLSPVGSSDPQTDDESSDEDAVIDVDFDELVPAEESEEKGKEEKEMPRKRGNVFTRSWKPRS